MLSRNQEKWGPVAGNCRKPGMEVVKRRKSFTEVDLDNGNIQLIGPFEGGPLGVGEEMATHLIKPGLMHKEIVYQIPVAEDECGEAEEEI